MIPLTKEMIDNGSIKVGDKVILTQDITGTKKGDAPLKAGTSFTVAQIPKDDRYPGIFAVNTPAGIWGFHFGNRGGGDYFAVEGENPTPQSEEEPPMEGIFGDKYGEIPYKILTTLAENPLVTRKSLIRTVLHDKLMVPMKDQRNVAYLIDESVLNLYKEQYVGKSDRKDNKGEPFLYLSDKGKEFIQEGIVQ
jgi:hypothetical protein